MKGDTMNRWRKGTVVIMLMGAVLLSGFPGLTATPVSAKTTPKAETDTAGKSGTSAGKESRVKKKRRSSGKGIVEETTESASQPKSQDAPENTAGTTLKFGSGGGGVSGATGK